MAQKKGTSPMLLSSAVFVRLEGCRTIDQSSCIAAKTEMFNKEHAFCLIFFFHDHARQYNAKLPPYQM
jgi:hypothetical protein